MGDGGQDWARVFAASGEAVGEGAGQPGFARMRFEITVSTKHAAPRGRFPHALRLAALVRAFDRIGPGSSLRPDRGGHGVTEDDVSNPHLKARGEQTEAIHRPPRGPPDFPRPGFIARPQPADIEERGSDALPTDGLPLSYTPSAMGRVQDAVAGVKRRDYSGLASESVMAAH